MKDIPLGELSLKGGFGIERILDFSMEERMGGHSFARITGMAQMTDSGYWGFEGAIANKEVEVSICGEENPLFTGIIQEVEAAEENGLHLVKICIASGSILLDLKKKSRSYQDVGLTYGEVIDQVLAPWDTAAIYPEELIRLAIGFPIIQYRETDWEFIERLASRFHLSLYPEPVMRGAKLYLGIPETGDARQLDEDEYVVHMDRRFYELGGDEYGFSRYQFVTYEVTSGENCRVGDGVDFHGQELFVCAKSGRAEGGQLVFTYVLAHSDWAASRRRGNQRFSGLSLLGTVEGCENETVRLRLDVDAGCLDQPLYPWTWVPETGNIMYMMPQAGSRVSLYFKGDEEASAIAVNCIRSGNGCAGADYRDKSLVTEHGMKMRLSQADMGFETLKNKVLLDDLSGIRMEGSGAFHILAASDVMMSGDSVTMSGTDGVAFYQGTVHVTENQPPALEIKAKIELSGEDDQPASNSRGKLSTYYLAWEHDDYSNPRYRFKDDPEEGKYDVMKEVRNVVGGIAVVIGAAAFVYGTFGAGAFIEGIAGGMAGGEALAAAAGSSVAIDMAAATMVGGLLTVGGMAASDLMNGHISSAEEYRRAALLGSITGFLTGAAGLVLADAGLLANMSAGFGIGFTQEAADSYFDDGEIDWGQCISNGVFAAAMSGIFYKWHGSGKGGESESGAYNELREQSGLTKDELDDVLKYTGKTAEELLADIKGTNLGDYLNGTTVSDILKKYNLKDIQDVWKLPGTKRGQVIEELLAHSEYSDWWNCGAEFGGYYPTIDFALGDNVVSLKTIDPSLPTYINGKGNDVIMDYIDDLASHKITVADKPATKYLDVRVPKNTKALLNIDDLKQYATKNNVILEIKEY